MKRAYAAVLVALAVLTFLSLMLNGVVIFELLQLRAKVPSSECQAREISVVVEVMMGEENVIYICRVQARLDHFLGGRGATIDHQKTVAHLQDKATPVPVRQWVGTPVRYDVQFHSQSSCIPAGCGNCAERPVFCPV